MAAFFGNASQVLLLVGLQQDLDALDFGFVHKDMLHNKGVYVNKIRDDRLHPIPTLAP